MSYWLIGTLVCVALGIIVSRFPGLLRLIVSACAALAIATVQLAAGEWLAAILSFAGYWAGYAVVLLVLAITSRRPPSQ